MSTKKKNQSSNKKEKAAVEPLPEPIYQWARELRGNPEIAIKPTICICQPRFSKPDARGFIKYHCDLTASTFKIPANAPYMELRWGYEYSNGTSDWPAEGFDIHPRLARTGPEGIREALANHIDDKRMEAARLLVRAEELETLLSEEFQVEFPAYWEEKEDGTLRDVKQ